MPHPQQSRRRPVTWAMPGSQSLDRDRNTQGMLELNHGSTGRIESPVTATGASESSSRREALFNFWLGFPLDSKLPNILLVSLSLLKLARILFCYFFFSYGGRGGGRSFEYTILFHFYLNSS